MRSSAPIGLCCGGASAKTRIKVVAQNARAIPSRYFEEVSISVVHSTAPPKAGVLPQTLPVLTRVLRTKLPHHPALSPFVGQLYVPTSAGEDAAQEGMKTAQKEDGSAQAPVAGGLSDVKEAGSTMSALFRRIPAQCALAPSPVGIWKIVVPLLSMMQKNTRGEAWPLGSSPTKNFLLNHPPDWLTYVPFCEKSEPRLWMRQMPLEPSFVAALEKRYW